MILIEAKKKMHFNSIKPKCFISLEEYFKFEFIDIFVEFEINFLVDMHVQKYLVFIVNFLIKLYH